MPRFFPRKMAQMPFQKRFSSELLLTRCEGFRSVSSRLRRLMCGAAAKKKLLLASQERQDEPLWHRLQTEKSSPPNVRSPLWQLAQLVLRGGA